MLLSCWLFLHTSNCPLLSAAQPLAAAGILPGCPWGCMLGLFFPAASAAGCCRHTPPMPLGCMLGLFFPSATGCCRHTPCPWGCMLGLFFPATSAAGCCRHTPPMPLRLHAGPVFPCCFSRWLCRCTCS